MSENKQRFPGFIGPSNTLRSKRFDSERTVNMYLESSPDSQGKGGEQMVLNSMPGLKLAYTLGAGPIRAIYQVSLSNHVYIVSGNSIYLMVSSNAIPTKIGIIATDSGYVSVADNGIQVVFVDGFNGYYTTINDFVPTITQIIDPNFYAANTVTFQDGYFIFSQTDTIYMFLSNLYDVTMYPLNMAGKTGNSDKLVGLISNNRELYMFGQNTTEVWWDSGQSGVTPFTRQDGKFSQIGCLSAGTICKLFNTVMWLGSNPEGGSVVYMMSNDQAQRVSNYAVETSLQSVSANLFNSTAYTWQNEGHYFYVLNVPGLNTTWVYDLSNQMWTEQQSNIGGKNQRHIAQSHVYFNGEHIVGDNNNGNIYSYDFDTYTDNGAMISRIRQSPHVSSSLNRIFYHLFEIDFAPGVGLANGSIPRVTLEISNDGGQTWTPPVYASLGRVGNYKARARWNRLGSSRDRVFRVTCTDPVKFQLLSAMMDLEIGTA